MERWDLYDKDRQKLGRTIARGAEHMDGEYHYVIHVCVFGSDGRMLIQQRQPFKSGWPDKWDMTVGGHALTGEDPQMTASRELMEELGLAIDFTGIRPHLTVNFNHGFDDFFLVTKDVDVSDLRLQYEEVQSVKWVTREEILSMREEGTFIPYHPALINLLFESRFGYGTQGKRPAEINRADVMNTDWVRLLLRVEKRRQLFIGDGDLLALWHFMGGYCTCVHEHNPGVDWLSHAFDDFVHEYYNDSRSASLYQLVAWNTNTKEEAFEKFFELFHRFLDKATAGE